MANQQNFMHQRNHRLQMLNESEMEKIEDLHKHAESELRQVIEQYETQILDSIEIYGKKYSLSYHFKEGIAIEQERGLIGSHRHCFSSKPL